MSYAWKPICEYPGFGDESDAVIIAVDHSGVVIVGEAYYFDSANPLDQGWWWANTGPGDYDAEKITDRIIAYCDMPDPPCG